MTIIGTLLIVGAVAIWAFSNRDEDSSAEFVATSLLPSTSARPATATTIAPVDTEPVDTDPVESAPAETDPVDSATVTTELATAVTEPSVTSTVPPTQPTPGVVTSGVNGDVSSDDPIRYAEFSGGKVYLRGTVPDRATADKVAARAAAVVGEGNVVVEYAIVPGTPIPNDAPLYVRDSILFAPGSSKLNPTATAVLDLGVLLFQQNPQMTMIIEGHTDSGGTFEENLLLSQSRVDAILRYFTSQGVDSSRVSGVAKGESEPQASNDTAEGRALNRRVEAQIINLLG